MNLFTGTKLRVMHGERAMKEEDDGVDWLVVVRAVNRNRLAATT